MRCLLSTKGDRKKNAGNSRVSNLVLSNLTIRPSLQHTWLVQKTKQKRGKNTKKARQDTASNSQPHTHTPTSPRPRQAPSTSTPQPARFTSTPSSPPTLTHTSRSQSHQTYHHQWTKPLQAPTQKQQPSPHHQRPTRHYQHRQQHHPFQHQPVE